MTSHALNVSSDGTWVTLMGVSRSALPTIVVRLSHTLLIEVDPTSSTPVEIRTMDYSRDRTLLGKLIGEPGVSILDRITDTSTTSFKIPFTATEAWQCVLELAQAEWALHWNPLPLDPSLLSLDLVRAQYQAIHLTGELPDKSTAMIAHEAAQALERLLAAGTVSEEATDRVRQAVRAVLDSLPLGYAATTHYTLPLPLSEEQSRQILDPLPPNPSALTTGSPDWRLTGHGPAASAENSITVIRHARNTRAITITVPAKPHTNPENTPTYQAFITDPETRATVAAATLTYGAESGEYTGHTIPQRSVRPSDQVDIRHYNNPNPPTTDPAARIQSREERQATRTYVLQRLQQSSPAPDGLFATTITELTYSGHLLREVSGDDARGIEEWLRLEVSAPTGVRSTSPGVSAGKAIKLGARDSVSGAVVTLLGAPERPWALYISAPRELGSVLVAIRWESGAETEVAMTHEAGANARSFVEPPVPHDVPVGVKIKVLD